MSSSRSRVVDRFVELEAELVKGAEERLAALADVFAADPALAPASGSKLEAALAAVRSGGRRGRDAATMAMASGLDGRGDGRDAERRCAPSRTPARIDAPDGERAATPARAEKPSAPASRSAPPDHAVVTPTSSDVIGEAVEEAAPVDTRLVVGKTPGVTAEDHVAEAGRKVMRFHLARMLAREAGTREGSDPEELHAMRVATRRQRAAWRVFGASFRPRPHEALPQRPARDRLAARGGPRPRRPARGGRRLPRRPAGRRAARARAAARPTGASTATTPGCC